MYNVGIVKRGHRPYEKLGPKESMLKHMHTGQCVFLLFTVNFCKQFTNESQGTSFSDLTTFPTKTENVYLNCTRH